MSDTPEITFHGAARTVTGSCMELRVGKSRMLIDCGLFQGSRTLEALNAETFGFDAARLDAVIVTHAHIDHSGLLPRLAREGYTGPLWCTAPTRDLLGCMLPDAGRIQESETERRNRRADRADEPQVEPIYTEEDAKQACALARPVALERWFEPMPGVRARLWNAGHILGSASVEIEAGRTRLLFSGDIGPEHKAFHPDPDAPQNFDHVICESTYGNRSREHVMIDERRRLLLAEIKAAMTRGGNLVIPVFALERTQELLLDVAMLINTGQLPHTQVFIDSPLASKTTGVFARHAAELEDMGSGEIFRHAAFHYVGSTSQSMRLNSVSGAIIMAASGMCESGRVRHHLRHNLGRRDSTVLFVGFQAVGTLGRTIMDGAARVRISGHDVAVRAQIRRLDSYSAHADQTDILRWINDRQPIDGSIFLTHGESDAMKSLRRLLQQGDAAASIITPELGERYALPPRAKARRLSSGRMDMEAVVGRDWQNAYADFAVNLKRELSEIESAAVRREAVERMRAVLQSYKANRMSRKTRPNL